MIVFSSEVVDGFKKNWKLLSFQGLKKKQKNHKLSLLNRVI